MTTINLLDVCVLLLFAMSAPQETKLRIQLSSEEIDDVTFDATRVSATDVIRWMQLAEDSSLFEPIHGIRDCPANDPEYAGCGKPQDENSVNVHNARITLRKMRKFIGELDSRNDPPGLAPVAAYLRRRQSFWLWMETQELAYFETGDVKVLESEFDHVDPKHSCGAILDKIRNSKHKTDAWPLVRHDWNNCVLHAEYRQIGSYPKDAWNSFLAAHGIREHITSTEEE